ncbi:hypothetical protein PFISCL1PPCAC_15128 [Pristionchus fissidentatus]|uniref:G-protein coupled receptors family 1 profile domain-containing protein n=1 Tax=Pristionchus fissidentatus TaxID=1538716 RepID=A0AAV5VWC5_9BILA|nr:hypothetical protein PFISCL1PPCAC_15128 [Pristionchus fissidentatus]
MHVAVSVFLGLVNLIVVCGNIFVLYLLASQPSLRSSTNSLVLSLTLSDLLLGLLILPFSIMQEHHGVWLYGEIFCRLWLSLDVFLSTASIYNLLAISVDRYMAVRQPIRYPIISSKRFVRQMIASVWLGALALALLILMVNRNVESGDLLCSPLQFPDPVILASASASFLLPAVLMIVLNLLIFQRVHMSRRSKSFYLKKGKKSGDSMRIHRGRTNSTSIIEMKECSRSGSMTQLERKSMDDRRRSVESTKTTTSEKTQRGEQNGDSLLLLLRGRIAPSLRTELRVARTTSVVVAAFVICWFPFMTIYLLQAYQLCPFERCVPSWLFTTTFWLGYANSALNPILYAAFSRDFRAAFRRVILHPNRPR